MMHVQREGKEYVETDGALGKARGRAIKRKVRRIMYKANADFSLKKGEGVYSALSIAR